MPCLKGHDLREVLSPFTEMSSRSFDRLFYCRQQYGWRKKILDREGLDLKNKAKSISYFSPSNLHFPASILRCMN